jgi:hypothetical protein
MGEASKAGVEVEGRIAMSLGRWNSPGHDEAVHNPLVVLWIVGAVVSRNVWQAAFGPGVISMGVSTAIS